MHYPVLNEKVGVRSLCGSYDSQEINEKGCGAVSMGSTVPSLGNYKTPIFGLVWSMKVQFLWQTFHLNARANNWNA